MQRLEEVARSHAALGRHFEVVTTLDALLPLAPERADLYFARAGSLMVLKRTEEALRDYDAALRLRSSWVEAHNNRGLALAALQRHDDALTAYDCALRLRADYPQALNNRALSLISLGHHNAALANCEQALAVRSDYFPALSNRGNCLRVLGRAEEAVGAYSAALRVRPNDLKALTGRAIALQGVHQHVAALEDVGRALHASAVAGNVDRAAHLETHLAQVTSLAALGQYQEALAVLEQVLEFAPQHDMAHLQRAAMLRMLERFSEAYVSYGVALDLLRARGTASGAQFSADSANMVAALAGLLFSGLSFGRWDDFPAHLAELTEFVRNAIAPAPFVFVCLSPNPHDQLLCATDYVAARHPAEGAVWTSVRAKHSRLRIAYLSSDFYEHATSYLMAGLFERHDRSRFEVTAVSFGPSASRSRMRKRLEQAFDQFIDTAADSDREVARRLRELEIDIAVDLKGHCADARPGVLALRPAPLQVSYLGYPGTTGAPFIDYLLADTIVIPEEHRAHFTEKIVYLPGSYQVNDARSVATSTPSRAALGLPENGFVFCCFNNVVKIQPAMFDVWMRVLKQTPGSVLWLLVRDPVARSYFGREAEARGVSPARLVYAAPVAQEQHLARQRQADLFLDTVPCNAHTTASDALWVGLPVLTCLGQTFAGRVCASLLHAVGAAELIAKSLTAYESLALELARDASRLGALRARLRDAAQRAPLFDTGRTTRHVERAYELMWERYGRGGPAESFSVPPLEI